MQVNSVQNYSTNFKGHFLQNRPYGELKWAASQGKNAKLAEAMERFEKVVIDKIEKECPKTSYYAIWPTVPGIQKVEKEEFNCYRNGAIIAHSDYDNAYKLFADMENVVEKDMKGEI